MSSYKTQINLMGTSILLYVKSNNCKNLIEKAEKMLIDFEKRFSANDENSDLSKINHAAGIEPVVVDYDLYKLIEIGKFHSIDSNRALNIAIGPLVQAWRIGFSDARKPKDEEIQDLVKIINPRDIILNEENRSVFLKLSGMKIDLGALAKGYFADIIMKFFKDNNAEAAMINLGGNLLTMGPPPKDRGDGMWRVGIQDPDGPKGEKFLILKTRDKSLVTSAMYERNFTYNGKSYHHILDSNTGYPIRGNVKSISIVSDSSLDGEIWTSRLFGVDAEVACEIVENLNGIEAVIVDDIDRVFVTSGLVSSVV